MQPPKLPSTRKLLAAALLLYFGRLLYKLARWVHHVLTSVDESKQIHHNCIPPADYKPTAVQQESLELVKQRYPELLPLVESGILVAVQPKKMLAGKLQQLQQQAGSAAGAIGEEQAQQELYAHVAENPALHGILVNELPELLFIVGTVHVSKQSAEQVEQVLRVSKGLQELCSTLASYTTFSILLKQLCVRATPIHFLTCLDHALAQLLHDCSLLRLQVVKPLPAPLYMLSCCICIGLASIGTYFTSLFYSCLPALPSCRHSCPRRLCWSCARDASKPC
jgi:hypothetical protein